MNQKELAEKMKSIDMKSISHLEREILENKKYNFNDNKGLEELSNIKSNIVNQIGKAEQINKKQNEELRKADDKLKNKEKDLGKQKAECELMDKNISKLEKDKEKYGMQAAQANAKYFHSLEQIKLKDNLISEFQKKNIETEAKLKQ